MKHVHRTRQGDLFGMEPLKALRQKIHDLDGSISKALKSRDYSKAKQLTEEQEKLLKELVARGENRD
ncbi:MAG TPA: hypothetical protein ENN03_02005 [bacterium]|nr:hypothetical protein [bacterium]